MNAALATFRLPHNITAVDFKACVLCGLEAIITCDICSEGLDKYGNPSPT
jgi:hypothetical protein